MSPQFNPLREGEGLASSALDNFGGGVGAMPIAGTAPSSGMDVGGISGNVGSGAGLLRTILGTAATALSDRQLAQAAMALGGVAGVAKLAQTIGTGSIGTLQGGVGAAGGAAAAVSAVLGLIAQQTGNQDLGMASQALSAAGTVAGMAGTAMGAGGAALMSGTAAAGTGLAAGTSAAIGAAGLAMAPIAIAYLAMSISDMITGPKDAEQLTARVGKHGKDLASFGQQLKTVPGLLDEVRRATPEQAVALNAKFKGIEDFYKESGIENLLKYGESSIQGHTIMGNPEPSWKYSNFKETFGQFTPFMQANAYGRLVSQDKAQQAGLAVAGPRSAAEWAQAMGSQAYFPKGGEPTWTSDPARLQEASNEIFRQQARASRQEGQWAHGIPLEQINSMTAPAGSDLWKELRHTAWGAPDTQAATYAPWLMENLHGPTKQDQAAADAEFGAQMKALYAADWQYMSPEQQDGYLHAPPVPSRWSQSATQQLGAIQPGQMEAGIRGLIGEGMNPFFAAGAAAPGTAEFTPGTLGRTGGMRTGVGQPVGAFGGQRSPTMGGQTATVSPNITQGVGTGFVSGGGKSV